MTTNGKDTHDFGHLVGATVIDEPAIFDHATRLLKLEQDAIETAEALGALAVSSANVNWVGDMIKAFDAKFDGVTAQVAQVAQAQSDLAPKVDAADASLTAILAGLDAASSTLAEMTEKLAAVQNPVVGLAIDALRMVEHINATGVAYQQAILVEADRRRTAKDAKETLSRLENGQMADFIMMADAGAGPLNGIAKTSKAWQTMLDAAMEKARSEDATLKSAAASARKTELAADEARAQMLVAGEAFSAAKHAADLMQVIIGAVSK